MVAFFVPLSLLLFAALALFAVSRYVRIAVAWGALVGPVLGFWFIAPLLLARHHFVPRGFTQWAVVDGYCLATFATLGLLLSLLTAWPLGLYQRFSGSIFRVPALAALAWVTVSVPAVYLLTSGIVEWTFFSKHAAPDFQFHVVAWAVAALTLVAIAGVMAYRLLAARAPRTASSVAVAFAMGLLFAGVAGLFVRAEPARPTAGEAALPLFVRESNATHVPPLLVIGLDGGNWRTLQPLIDRGLAPTFAALVVHGVHGEMHAQWPPYWSSPAWGAILTGHSQDEVGVHEDAAGTAPGLPMFELPLTLSPALNPMFLIELALIRAHVITPALAPRSELRLPPVWERLSAAGSKTAVVAFPFTYPVDGQTAYVVSNRVATDLWEMLGVQPGDRSRSVGPPGEADKLLALFDHGQIDPAEIDTVAPPQGWPQPADAIVDPSGVVTKVMDTSERMFSVATELARTDRSLSMVMLYTSDFDSICHAFWQYRFPEDYPDNPPAAADVATLGPVVDRYLEYLDRRIGQLIAAFPETPNVIVVSDHGEEASRIVTLWRAWHGPHGMFVAAGPSVTHRDGSRDASYYDVAPTILDLLRFQPAADMRGGSLVDPLAVVGPQARN